MDNIYSGYSYKRFKPKRSIFLIVVIILFLAVAAGLTALYFGGFRFSMLKAKNDESDMITMPEIVFWTVEVPNIETKIAAINQSFASKSKGGAGYLLSEGGKWTVIEGVYLTSADANREMIGESVTETAVSNKYVIPPKKIPTRAKEVFTAINTAFNTLIAKRGAAKEEITLIANSLYAELKNKKAELQNEDRDLVYIANQSILALYKLLYINDNVNTALANIIFSLL